MAKVKVIGDLNVEFEVKFNQPEDLVFESKAINVDGRTIYIGKTDIEKINNKAFSFIMDRIEYFIKKHGGHILNIYAFKEDDTNYKIMDFIERNKIEPLKTILASYRFNSPRATQKMINDEWFVLSKEGLKKYAERYYENKS